MLLSRLQDETRKKAASTYLVENSDVPPPRYQKDGTLPMSYPNNSANSGMSIIGVFFSSFNLLRYYSFRSRNKSIRGNCSLSLKPAACVVYTYYIYPKLLHMRYWQQFNGIVDAFRGRSPKIKLNFNSTFFGFLFARFNLKQ